MTGNLVSSPAEREVARITLPEWLRLRRHPMPEFHPTLQALPQSLLDLALPLLPHGQVVEGALVLPGEFYARKKIHWEYVPERALIFLPGAVLYVAGQTQDAASRAMLVDARSLLYLRSTLLLLYGLLEFEADCGNQAGDVRLEYNTIIWQALREPLARLVAAASPPPPSVDQEEVRARNASLVKSLPYKFANGVRYYVLDPGELLHAAVFQPAIWHRRGVLPQQITPNTLFALTDRKLVLIEEKRASAWQRKRSEIEYGWIFTYIPRGRVAAVAVTQGAGGAELKMRLEWGSARDERSFLLEPGIAAQFEQAWHAHRDR